MCAKVSKHTETQNRHIEGLFEAHNSHSGVWLTQLGLSNTVAPFMPDMPVSLTSNLFYDIYVLMI